MVGNVCDHSYHNLYKCLMENVVVRQIGKIITRSKFDELFLLSCSLFTKRTTNK